MQRAIKLPRLRPQKSEATKLGTHWFSPLSISFIVSLELSYSIQVFTKMCGNPRRLGREGCQCMIARDFMALAANDINDYTKFVWREA